MPISRFGLGWALALLAFGCTEESSECKCASDASASGGAGADGAGASGGASTNSGGTSNGGSGTSGGTAGAGAATTDDLLPADRKPPPGIWESAGVEGGIPERETICATVTEAPYNADSTGATSAVAAIQSAIDACGDGEVVSVPAGTYLIDGTLEIQKSITLRGSGADTVFQVTSAKAIRVGSLGPWPPPKANPDYNTPITDGATRNSTSATIGDTSSIEVGKMIMIDEEDDPDLVWTKGDSPGRYRASMHLVESKTDTEVTFRPPLALDFTRSPQLSWFPDFVSDAGIESIKFVGTDTTPDLFIDIQSAYNVWVYDCEFTQMPSKTVMVTWSAHIELRKNFMHDQVNGGPNSEGLDFLTDVSSSLIVDNVCVAGGFPQINIGDGGANPFYSGGVGNVIAYNYAIDAYYTDPPTSPDAGKMPSDISTNHSPHSQYNLVEGNVMGRFGSDAYHGSGSHTVLLRNLATGTSSWTGVTNRLAVQIDRRNLYYSLVGNVLGVQGEPAMHQYAEESGWDGTAIYRLGFPDMGNDGYDGTFPPTELTHGDGGPRDLYVDRTTTEIGTTFIEGNWDSAQGDQDFSDAPAAIPASYFLSEKPAWFGSLAWPPIDPENPVTDDPTIIPAGYRYVNGEEP
jgi:hypothetical protein